MPLTIFFTAPGTYTIDDDGIRGNGTSVVRNAAGAVIFTFTHPADTMNFTMTTAGVNLIFNVADSFGTANVTVGSLTTAAESPDSIVVRSMRTDGFMTLASNGSIAEGGSDAPADLIAAALSLSAVGGIGTAGNALETQTTFIEAETTSGGINLANFGIVQIGGITASIDGLDVATSGNLSFSTTGSIFIADTSGPEMVHGGDISGNVTLTAIGGDADIYTTINAVAVRAAGGGVTLNAGRDVLVGIGGTNYDNDILATNFVAINAGRDFILDGTSNIRTSAFGGVVGGPIDIQAGRNITLSNTTGGLQSIEAFLGNVTLTTGPGGIYLSNAGFPAAVQSSHDVTLNADVVLLNSGGLNTTGVGRITIRPVTPGRAIELGTALDPAGALALSEAELDRLFTLNIDIGDANSGPVDFSGAISPTTFPISLTVRSATEILVRSAITLDGSLTLHAGNDLYFTPAGSFTSSGGGFTGIVDAAQNDDGIGGIGDLGGSFAVTGSMLLSGNLDNDTLNGSVLADTIQGLAGADTLRGLGGADVLDGGTGADRMEGGLADDVYYVDNAGDTAIELAAQGLDTVFTSVTFTLGADVERLFVTSVATTNALELSGNALGNEIAGNNGANVIDGKAGADQMTGHGGNDIYFVDHAGDVVIETLNQGLDTIFTSVSFTLIHDIERLGVNNFSTTFAINLTGNGLANEMWGNDGANVIDGRAGADLMTGFGGNDVYFVDNAGDVIMESGIGGYDTVFTSIAYTLSDDIERVAVNGASTTFAINLTGNARDNEISGNNGANVLAGQGGSDLLIGNGGADLFVFTSSIYAGSIDQIADFQAGIDRIGLDDGEFAGLSPGVLPASAFRSGSAAADADDRIIYNPATGQLFFDADGNGAGAAVQFANLSNGLSLSASDFQVI